MAIRIDQVGASGSFGFVPLLVGTLLISAVAMLIAVPVGLAGLSPSVAAERAAHEREEPGRRWAAHESKRPPE